MLLGAHMSISGGIDKSVERGQSAGCNVVQVFSKSSNQWRSKELTENDRQKVLDRQRETGVKIAAVHDSYLINLGQPDDEKWEKSIAAFIEEVERTRFLEIPSLVFHPGSHLKTGESSGIKRVSQALNNVLDKIGTGSCGLLIETTAGQGTNLGYRFEHIRDIICGMKPEYQDDMGVCLDTCHIFAAGYDIKSDYNHVMNQFDSIIGLDKIRLFHINDSKKELGSRVDRHEHIGKGFLGIDPFRHLLSDNRINSVPMVLETPKEDDLEDDRIALGLLRGLSHP